MIKWILRLIAIAILGWIGISAYHTYRSGYLSLPDLPEDAYAISFDNGFRAIVHDADIADDTDANAPNFAKRLSWANRDRRYLGIPLDVAPWFEDVWSTCQKPTTQEAEEIAATMPNDLKVTLRGARLDAVCKINVDEGQSIWRGFIYSVPRL